MILSKGPGHLDIASLVDNFDILVSNTQIEAENVLCDTLRSCKNISGNQTEQDCILDLIEMLRQDINAQVDFFKDFDEEDCSDIKTVEEELNLWSSLSQTKDQIMAKKAREFVRRLERLLPLVNDIDKTDINQLDGTFGQIKSQLDLIIDQRRTQKYNPIRFNNLLDIISNSLLHKARIDNDHLDIFDQNNTNMRLRMCMWKNLMEKYLKYIDDRTRAFYSKNVAKKLEVPSFHDHIKK